MFLKLKQKKSRKNNFVSKLNKALFWWSTNLIVQNFSALALKTLDTLKKKKLWGFFFKNQKRDFLGVKINSF